MTESNVPESSMVKKMSLEAFSPNISFCLVFFIVMIFLFKHSSCIVITPHMSLFESESEHSRGREQEDSSKYPVDAVFILLQ